MSSSTDLNRYRYDPLNRVIEVAGSQRFYNQTRLATEIQGAVQRSMFQSGDLLLAERGVSHCTLLATDQQRSVLHAASTDKKQSIAYNVYGHRPVENGLLSLLGFNGERADPITGHYLLGNGYRAFNPVLMRFNSPDSMSPFELGGINSYGYCGGDPINFSDPSGHMVWSFSKSSGIKNFFSSFKKPRADGYSMLETGSKNKTIILENIEPGDGGFTFAERRTSKGIELIVDDYNRPRELLAEFGYGDIEKFIFNKGYDRYSSIRLLIGFSANGSSTHVALGARLAYNLNKSVIAYDRQLATNLVPGKLVGKFKRANGRSMNSGDSIQVRSDLVMIRRASDLDDATRLGIGGSPIKFPSR